MACWLEGPQLQFAGKGEGLPLEAGNTPSAVKVGCLCHCRVKLEPNPSALHSLSTFTTHSTNNSYSLLVNIIMWSSFNAR